MPFKLSGLLVQPPQRTKFFITAKLRFLHGRFEHLNRLVVDLERHREWVSIQSVLLWLQGNWAEPDPPRFYPLNEVERGSRYYSIRRTHAALNRRDARGDLPAFLPAGNTAAHRRG